MLGILLQVHIKTMTGYKNVPNPNDPAVVKDETERDAAQAIIDKTPQSVIDSINT